MNFLTRSSVAAFFFSLAFTLAVVDRTAVATLVKVSFFGGFVDAGYAKTLGLAFETYSNLGTCEQRISSSVKNRKAANYFEITIEANDPSWRKRQAGTMCERVPVPKLAE